MNVPLELYAKTKNPILKLLETDNLLLFMLRLTLYRD